MILTQRLQIRPIEASDWKRVQEIRVKFQQSPYGRFDRPFPTEEDAVRERVAGWARADAGRFLFFAVCLQKTVIGYVAFAKRKDSLELGYCFHGDFHRKGYAKESMQALFAEVKRLGARKISAGTALENLPSVALLRSLGFALVRTEQVSFAEDGETEPFAGGLFELVL